MVILYSRWLHLSISTRIKIADVFGIIKKGSTEVSSNEIKSDGYLIQDIEKTLTLEAMQKFLNCRNDDMGFVFNLLVDKIEGRELVGLIPQEPALTVLPPEEVTKFNKEFKARKAVIKKLIKKNAKNK